MTISPLEMCGDQNGRGPPDWLLKIRAAGYRPYVATAAHMLPFLNLNPFGQPVELFLLDDADHQSFHEAYLTANALGFDSPGLKMENWVLIDCVYMQTALVGFAKQVADVPDNVLRLFNRDRIDISSLRYLPITGQIASPSLGGNCLVGISLFSLRRQIGDEATRGIIALGTKALAMEVWNAQKYEWFYGISQYDNTALHTIHGRFGSRIEIHRPMVKLHPRKDMTLIYRMKIDFDPYELGTPLSYRKESFRMKPYDGEAKRRMEEGIREGKSYIIVPPFFDKETGELLIAQEEPGHEHGRDCVFGRAGYVVSGSFLPGEVQA